MAKQSRLAIAKNEIFSTFSKAPQKAFSHAQLTAVLRQNRHAWQLAKYTTLLDFISFLTKHGKLRAHTFRSENYAHEITRYSWGKMSPQELALCIKPRAYLCHGTALTLHGLATLNTNKIYVNVEQSIKRSSERSLTQDAINRAFSTKQRQSNLIYTYDKISVIMIAGKNTNRLGVEQRAGSGSELIQVTDLERTLIDITVRPAYADGIPQVYNAYRAAKDRVSVDRLLEILKKLDYVYPYHQSIGFLMQETGYPEKSCAKLRALGLNHDFYLAHAMQEPEYSKHWRLFYPKNLK